MNAPHWAGGPQTDGERRGAHAWFTTPDVPTVPAVPAPREAAERVAIRAALRDARTAALAAYQSAARGVSNPDALHATLAGIAAAQTALDGEAPRRRFAPQPGRRPMWANCGGPR